jgi:hypothetical protein
LSNDLFSFEKEVIDNGSDSNLVMIIALNEQGYTLEDSIQRAAGIVKALLMELLSLLDHLDVETGTLMDVDRPLALQLRLHREGIIRCVQAIWLWHCYSGRYKRRESLWVETTLAAKSPVSDAGGVQTGAGGQAGAGAVSSSAAAFSDRG